MHKLLLSLLLLVVVTIPMNARQLSEDEAFLKASKFGKTLTKGVHLNSKVNRGATLKLEYVKKVSDQNLFYVFNKGENQGYVIVSGDDRANEILGYSDQGTFDINNLPENMKSWLEVYSEDLQILAQNPEMKTATPLIDNSKGYAASVSPLLETVAWNQNSPYNDLCPKLSEEENAAAGCVATAVSQIMYYHKWPIRGTGSHSYISETEEYSLSANFDTEYEWSKMTPTYNSSSSAESRSAVAKLVYHVGVAFEMNYGPSSGAFTARTPNVLRTYFKYDKGMYVARREYYKINEWIDLLKKEINEKRVFVHAGQSKGGGHAFVCDGYDENNMFHINWGWGGSSNGYFQVTAMTPSTHGIGGGSADGYNSNQFVVLGIKKETANPKINYGMRYETIWVEEGEYAKNSSQSFTVLNFYNTSEFTANGQAGLGLYRGDEFIAPVGMKSISFEPNYGNSKFYCNVTIPNSVTDGEYQIYPILKVTDSNEYIRAKSSIKNNFVKYIVATVSGTQVKYSAQTDYQSVLKVTNLGVSEMYVNREAQISFDISNSGAEYYNTVTAKLVNSSSEIVATGFSNIINVQMGETQSVKFGEKFDVAPGDYKLAIYNSNNIRIGSSIAVTVNEEPADADLTVVEAINFADNSNVPKNKVQLTAKIKNTGGYHVGSFILFIFDPKSSSAVASIVSKSVTIDEDQTCDVVFDGTLSLENGEYYARVYNRTPEGSIMLEPRPMNRVAFTLTDAVLGVESVEAEKTVAYPNPVTDVVNITCEKEMNALRIFDITGRFVGEQQLGEPTNNYLLDMTALESGNYFIQVVTADGVNVVRVIKK